MGPCVHKLRLSSAKKFCWERHFRKSSGEFLEFLQIQ